MSEMFAEHRSLVQRYLGEGRDVDEVRASNESFFEQMMKPLEEERDRSEVVMVNAKAAYEKAKTEMA